MSPAFSARRRADQFDALLRDRGSAGDGELARYAELLTVVDELHALPQVAPRAEFSADLRERLMLAADTALVPADPAEEQLRLPVRRTGRDRRLATVLGGAALLGATTSMAVAAQSALPGDSLYPVKRALEEAETGLADEGSELGHTLLANATGRLVEVNALTMRGTAEGIAAVPDTLVAFEAQSTDASQVLIDHYEETGDRRAIADLRDFAHDSMQVLRELEGTLPESARDELVGAARTLTEIDDRARELCPSCGGAGITELPRFLLSAGEVSGRSVAPSLVTAQLPVRPAPSPEKAPARKRGEQREPGLQLPTLDLDSSDDTTDGPEGDAGATTDADTGDTSAPEPGGPSSTTSQGDDPLKDLTDAITEQGSSTAGNSAGSDDPVGDVLDEVDETADDVLGPLG